MTEPGLKKIVYPLASSQTIMCSHAEPCLQMAAYGRALEYDMTYSHKEFKKVQVWVSFHPVQCD